MSDVSKWADIEYVIQDPDGTGYWVAVNPHMEYPSESCPIETTPVVDQKAVGDNGIVDTIVSKITGANGVMKILVHDDWGIVVTK